MFLNVLATTRELERARVDGARLAVTEERLRFSRDLHDVFGRTLSAVALKAELGARQAEASGRRGLGPGGPGRTPRRGRWVAARRAAGR
ncbi:hypothetical protein ET989_09645 [Propioniciclava sinopodophylli]|uniref:Signal transduction histidine kinase subgroup 3 dimerisation and phosphoacceptor domain-containing protein n=2 Tax=Propioniciclava sinopodophylli TaxID=1837344 RepID=A0A4Q9KCS5_9ACTN|nr:hypothetical protein ET989_09645 [Propioniciclava sinopodophylli]